MTDTKKIHYPWFSLGDLNAFFALFLDNVVNLVVLAAILIFGFSFPKDVVFGKMIPGTALGVMIGDFIYTYMAYKLFKRTNNPNVTAMPLGLDTPSTIGVAVAVLGPAFIYFKSPAGGSMTPDAAANLTWYVGMATMLWMGLVKFVTSFFGATIQRVVPAAGLLGSLAGIGMAWLAANSFVETMELPIVGMLSLGIVLFSLVAHYYLPGKLPGAAAAVLIGVVFYFFAGAVGLFHAGPVKVDIPALGFTLPTFQTGGFSVMFTEALKYVPIAIPFGFLTILGGINVTETARIAGDDYKTRNILLAESFATVVAGAFGGVSQSTPYIGHSAYKRMGAKMGYTFVTALLIGIGGFTGLISVIVEIIPKAAVAPILIFVGFEIVMLAYQEAPKNHNMAVTFAIIPSIINFGYIKLKLLFEPVKRFVTDFPQTFNDASPALKAAVAGLIPFSVGHEFPILQAMAQGFILTSMIWGSVTAFLIDRELLKAAITLLIGAVLTYFGIVHSVTSTGEMYLPFRLNTHDANIVYSIASAYAILAAVILILGKFSKPGSANSEH